MPQDNAIDTAHSLLQKLERTFERRPLYKERQLDWVFDTAVTAWHLVDWYAIQTGEKLGTAQDRLKKSCPELAVCEQICNGAKHLILSNPNLKPFNVATDVAQTNDLKGMSRAVYVGETNVEIILTPVVRIVDRNRGEWEAIDLFRKVVVFWRDKLGTST